MAKTPKEARPGSKRAKIIDLMSRPAGATAAAMRRATGWDDRTLRDALRLCRVANGYPVQRKEDTYRIPGPRKRPKKPPAPKPEG